MEEERINKRPLVLSEPIGSIKVLHNNSVQVNLIHLNNSEDPIHLLLSDDGGRTFQNVELKYSNLILNLEGGKDYVLKTKETGTKFNFTITASDIGPEDVNELEEHHNISKSGCWEEGKFYAVGEFLCLSLSLLHCFCIIIILTLCLVDSLAYLIQLARQDVLILQNTLFSLIYSSLIVYSSVTVITNITIYFRFKWCNGRFLGLASFFHHERNQYYNIFSFSMVLWQVSRFGVISIFQNILFSP